MTDAADGPSKPLIEASARLQGATAYYEEARLDEVAEGERMTQRSIKRQKG